MEKWWGVGGCPPRVGFWNSSHSLRLDPRTFLRATRSVPFDTPPAGHAPCAPVTACPTPMQAVSSRGHREPSGGKQSRVIEELLRPYVAQIEQALRDYVPPLDRRPSFFGQLHYHLGWAGRDFSPESHPGGKRIRSAMTLMVCEAFAGTWQPAVPAAVAVELLHEFSLIHDDIEDRDVSRRHRPALWTVVGEAQAINAGDGLFALAQIALLRSREHGWPADRVLEAMRRFNETAVALCVGQHLDMSFEQTEVVEPEHYLEMVDGKTAALLSFAAAVGALAAGAPTEQVDRTASFARHLGLGFQMRDDLLGLWGDSRRTGKPVGADIAARKKSLPVLFALAQPESARLRALYAGPLDSANAIAEASALILASGAKDYVEQVAARHEAEAREILDQLDLAAGRAGVLHRLADSLAMRDY